MNVLLVLPHSLHVRNFVASGLVDMLAARGHRLTLVVPDALAETTMATVAVLGEQVRVCGVNPYRPWWLAQWLRKRFRIASFVEREHLSTYSSTYKHKITSRRTKLKQKFEIFVYRVLRKLGSLERLGRKVEQRIPPKQEAARLISDVSPDIVVTSTYIQDALDVEIMKAAKRARVPVLGFPVSWDTLTSKGGFQILPDALMVWGEDTKRHAQEAHGYRPDQVFVTGPPHFDVYAPTSHAEPRERFLARHGIDPSKRLLLFAGTTVTYWADEPMQLAALSRSIESGELRDCAIWYRPHPKRKYEHIAKFVGLPGVHIDPTVMKHQQGLIDQNDEGTGFSTGRDDLAHYRALIDACDGVIAAFSTMIIEAALMGKPSLVVAFGLADGPDRVVQHADYDHMRDVVNTPGITLVRSMPELLAGVRGLLAGDYSIYTEALRKRASEIAHAQDGRARERMIDVIERVAVRRTAVTPR